MNSESSGNGETANAFAIALGHADKIPASERARVEGDIGHVARELQTELESLKDSATYVDRGALRLIRSLSSTANLKREDVRILAYELMDRGFDSRRALSLIS